MADAEEGRQQRPAEVAATGRGGNSLPANSSEPPSRRAAINDDGYERERSVKKSRGRGKSTWGPLFWEEECMWGPPLASDFGLTNLDQRKKCFGQPDSFTIYPVKKAVGDALTRDFGASRPHLLSANCHP